MQPTRANSALGILIALGLIWGSGYALARYCVTGGVTPLGYAFWQALGPAIVLCCCNIITKQPHQFSGKNIRFYLLCGLLGIAIPNANMYFCAQHLPAGILAVLVNTVPMFTVILAWLLNEAKPNLYRNLGVALCVIGVMLLCIPKTHLQQYSNPWILIALVSPLCFSCTAVYSSKYRPNNTTGMQLAAGMMVAASIWLTPVVLLTHNFYPLWRGPYNLRDGAIILEIFLSAIGYFLFFRLIARAGAVYYSLVGGVVACTGLFWGYILFNEKLTVSTGIAAAIIIAGIVCCTKQQSTRARQ